MKKLLLILLISVSAFIQSCQGPEGPQGPQGPQGADGVGLNTQVFELKNVNFTSANNYGIRYEFPASKIEVLEGDVVLVYVLWEVDGNVPVWRALPQQYFFPEGIAMYNFSHTLLDVDIFLEAQFGLNTLPSSWRTNQTFRVAIIPTEYVQGLRTSGVDYNNYEDVAQFLNVKENDVLKVQAQ